MNITASERKVYLIAALLYKGHFQKAICCALECQIWILVHVTRAAPHVSDTARNIHFPFRELGLHYHSLKQQMHTIRQNNNNVTIRQLL